MKKTLVYINTKFGENIINEINLFKNKKRINYLSFSTKKNSSKETKIIKECKKNFFYNLIIYMQEKLLKKYSDNYRYDVIRKDFKIIIFFFIISIFKKIFYNRYFVKFLLKNIKNNIYLENLLKKKEYSRVVIFSGYYGIEELLLIKTCKKYKIKIVLVVDGWDNLATKMPIIYHPDILLVWGKEMKDLYKKAHYLLEKTKNIYSIGSYRFSYIYSKISKINLKTYKKNYFKWIKRNELDLKKINILFVESIREKNPEKILKILDDIIAKKFDNIIHIIYRAHPLRKKNKFNYLNVKKLKNITIDADILNNLNVSKTRDNNDKDVDYKQFIIADSFLFCSSFISQISTSLIDLIYCKKIGALLTTGTPTKLFQKLKQNQCFLYICNKYFSDFFSIYNLQNNKKIINFMNYLIKNKNNLANLNPNYNQTNVKRIRYIMHNKSFIKYQKDLNRFIYS
jgi:hypothetical protein